MITISLCMIVKNEQEVLARCLRSVAPVVDEIIIVDTGSQDDTRQIALQFTPHVYDFPWQDDFAAARNFSFSKATMDYQMWLDADDLLPEDQARLLADLKRDLPADTDVVTMQYHTHFDDQGHPLLTSTRERLLRRERGFVWQEPVHEYIAMSGNILRSPITIWHKKQAAYTDRNLNIYRARQQAGQPFSPRATYYFARELAEHGLDEPAIQQFEAFLTGGQGWVEDNIAACFALANCCSRLGRHPQSRRALLRSFDYAAPRAEILCQLGYHAMRQEDLPGAVFWFEAALHAPAANNGGFVLHDYWGYIPHMELCVCYDRLGNRQKAIEHHLQAAAIKPDAPAVQHNQAYFANSQA